MEKIKSYVAMFIVDPSKEEAIEVVKNEIKAIISDNSGKIADEKLHGKKALAYPMKKKAEGIYYEMKFSALPSAVEKIKRQCQIKTDILRTLIENGK